MSQSRKNHYIPRFILCEFAGKKQKIWWTRTDGHLKEPRHVKVETVFFENDLYTVLSDRNERSDRNEHRLADKESQWARALRKIRQLVSEGRDGQIEEGDELALALDYYLHAGFRTPEHLDEVMHGGEHTPREVIEKVTEGDLDEAGYNRLEHNIRADLGSGQPDLVKAKIKKFKRTLGLGVYKLDPEIGSLIIGSCGAADINFGEQKMYFIPVAPDMALFCTNLPGRLLVTSEQGKKGVETLHMMNTAIWNASKQVVATSPELLKATEKRA